MMVQKPTEAPLFPFWIEDRGLSFFFGFLVFITIFVPMVHLSRSGRIALDLIFALMLFSGAVATIRKKILMYLVIALTGVELIADLIVEFSPYLGHRGWDTTRSEERRVGKECRSRWGRYHYKKNRERSGA